MLKSENLAVDAQLNALTSLGLSQYESKCFLASLHAGPSTVNQIGITAGVPRTKVYGAVRKLVERGLLEQGENNPKIFSARAPRDVLIPLLEKEQLRIKQNLESLLQLETIHQSMKFVKNPSAQSASKVVRLSPRTGVTVKIKELFESANERVVVLTTANGLVRLSKLAELLYERSKLGVMIEIYCSQGHEPIFRTAVQSLKEISTCTIVFVEKLVPIEVVLVDSNYVLISELKPDDLRGTGMDVGFLIKNTEMADLIEGLVRVIDPKRIALATS